MSPSARATDIKPAATIKLDSSGKCMAILPFSNSSGTTTAPDYTSKMIDFALLCRYGFGGSKLAERGSVGDWIFPLGDYRRIQVGTGVSEVRNTELTAVVFASGFILLVRSPFCNSQLSFAAGEGSPELPKFGAL